MGRHVLNLNASCFRVRSLSVPSSTSVTSGLASLAAGAVPKSPQYKPSKVNPEAGSDLLEYYQVR